MKVIIVEDEYLAAQKLTKLLLAHDPAIEILATLETVSETVQWLQSEGQPDLLFLDIHLADSNGFDIFRQIMINCPVIFTTAYDEYALKAFEVNSIAYLLKPITPERLAQALEKYQQLKKTFSTASFDYQKLIGLLQPKAYKDRFLVKNGQKIKTIPTEDIAYFYAEDGVVFLKTVQNQAFILDYTLEQLEQLLHPHQFFRANRKFLISINSIAEVQPYFKGRLHVYLQPATAEQLIISNERAGHFKQWMGG
ncbi:MAG: LytR/AlgR family response regulator transcription factor [Saprospiraceae bacterium]